MAEWRLEIDCVVVGSPSRGPVVGPVRLELASERLSVRELIARAVRRQVADLREARRLSHDEVRRALDRQYVTAGASRRRRRVVASR